MSAPLCLAQQVSAAEARVTCRRCVKLLIPHRSPTTYRNSRLEDSFFLSFSFQPFFVRVFGLVYPAVWDRGTLQREDFAAWSWRYTTLAIYLCDWERLLLSLFGTYLRLYGVGSFARATWKRKLEVRVFHVCDSLSDAHPHNSQS